MPVITEKKREVVFLFNLVQDVNTLRGLAQLVRRELGPEIRLTFLASGAFPRRDKGNIWWPELARLAEDLGATLTLYSTAADAEAFLDGKGGVILAGSESQLENHHETRDIFRAALPGFVTITLQHGLECVGFRQSREHVLAHGLGIPFAADIICAWQPEDRLTALAPSERPKLRVTGPSLLLNERQPHPDHPPLGGGLVCENLHSVRLSASGNHRGSFMEIFEAFCAAVAQRDQQVTLRPHPGGQYVLRNDVPLPPNVRLNTLPIYHVDLAGYAYGISAPSTILLDMVLAGLPTAVWCDPDGVMDASAYEGLAMISGLEDWLAFLRDVDLRRAAVLARQEAYLQGLGLPRDPEEIGQRFLRLIRAGLETHQPPARPVAAPPVPAAPKTRLLMLSDAGDAAPQLGAWAETWAEITHLTQTQVTHVTGGGQVQHASAGGDWLAGQLARAAPDLIVITSWSGRDLGWLRGLGPVLVLAQPGFDPQVNRALLEVADLVHLAQPENHSALIRAGVPAHRLTHGSVIAALARAIAMRGLVDA